MESIKLTTSEWKIMNLLWNESPLTTTQLVARLGEETGWAKSTVITLLGRLEEKGAIGHREQGRAKAYSPLLEREVVELREAQGFLDRVFGGSVGLMLNTLIEKNALTDQDIRELNDILDDAQK